MEIAMTEEGLVRVRVPMDCFEREPMCRKCRNPRMGRVERWLNMIFRGQRVTPVGMRFCKGGLPPSTEPVGLARALGEPDRDNICAGVEQGHMHVVCGRCGAQWLMHTADGH